MYLKYGYVPNGKSRKLNVQFGSSVPVIYHLGPIINHSATFLFSPWLNSTGSRGIIDVLFQNKATTLLSLCAINSVYVNLYYVIFVQMAFHTRNAIAPLNAIAPVNLTGTLPLLLKLIFFISIKRL